MPITDYDGQLQTIARNLGEEPALTTTDGLLEAIAKGTENIITEDELDDYAPLDSPALTGTPTAPTPTAGDNSTKIATTEFVNGYLPLSGGTMTGGIISTVGDIIKNSYNNSAIRIVGGTDDTSSWIGLWPKNHSSTPGVIQLRSSDGTNEISLVCFPNGTLRFGGQNVEVVDSSLFSTGSGWIRYKNGLQICCDNAAASNDGVVAVSFAKAFSAVPVIVLGRASITVSATVECAKTANRTTTGFDLLLTNGSYMSGQVSYIAIGNWI